VKGFASSRFRWKLCYQAVRKQPYNVIFKSDDSNPDVRLSDISNINIRVLGPAPHLINALPVGKSIKLSWPGYLTNLLQDSIYTGGMEHLHSNPIHALQVSRFHRVRKGRIYRRKRHNFIC